MTFAFVIAVLALTGRLIQYSPLPALTPDEPKVIWP